MPAIGHYRLELRCDHLWHVGERRAHLVTGETRANCSAYARSAGWHVGTKWIFCRVCVKNHAERVARRKLERASRQKHPSKCPVVVAAVDSHSWSAAALSAGGGGITKIKIASAETAREQ